MKGLAYTAAAGALLAGTVLTALPASAQVDEIIVTAQRRSEAIQKVPITISAFNASTLEKTGVKTTEDVAFVSPGVQFGRQINAMVVTLRGVGTSQAGVGAEPSVALYLDGFYLLDARSNVQRLNNLERVEVLRGPQGTLFGRNATGGAVQFITKDPTFSPSLKASVGYGNYNTVEGSFYAATGLTKTLAADVSVTGSTQGKGWGTNLFDGKDIGLTDSFGFRTKWLLQPSENFTAKLTYDYGENNSNVGEARQVAPGHRGFGGANHVGGFYDTNLSLYPWSRSTFWGTTSTLEYNASWFTIRNLAQYRATQTSEDIDSDGGAFAVTDATQHQATKYWTEEFQILSNGSGKLTWILGGFYTEFKNIYDPLYIRSISPAANNSIFTRSNGWAVAGYAQATYPILEHTRITGGFRYTVEERNFYGNRCPNGPAPTFAIALNCVPVVTPANFINPALVGSPLRATKPNFRATIDHDVADNVLIYFTHSTGFKSGIFAMSNLTNPGVNPETLKAYEGGIKSDLFGRRLRVNASVFYYDWKNVQLSRTILGGSVLENAAASKVKGGEVEITAAPTENLTIQAAFSIIHGRYSSFPNAFCTVPNPAPAGGNTAFPAVCDVAGNPIVRTPPYTASLMFDYTIPATIGEFGINVSYLYTHGFPWEPDGRLREQAVQLINSTLSFSPAADSRFKVRLWGKNLGGQEYYLYQTASTAFGDNASVAAPRTYGFAIDFDLNK